MFGTWKDKIGSKASELSLFKEKIQTALDAAIDENWPKIVTFLDQKVGAKAVDAIYDDEIITRLAEFLYPWLPGLLRLALKEEAFVAFMLEHRATAMDPLVKRMRKQRTDALLPAPQCLLHTDVEAFQEPNPPLPEG